AAEDGMERPARSGDRAEGAVRLQRDGRRDRPEHGEDRTGAEKGGDQRAGAEIVQLRDGRRQAFDREPVRQEDRGRDQRLTRSSETMGGVALVSIHLSPFAGRGERASKSATPSTE